MRSFFVDSFTDQAFKGNPAGVCLEEGPVSELKMLQIAAEFGFSETAFVRPRASAGEYDIRYFSPKQEIPLCGHATLASARILIDQEGLQALRFFTVEQLELKVSRSDEELMMEFPVYSTEPLDSVPPAMLEALGIRTVNAMRYSERNKIILLEIPGAAELAALKPDFQSLLTSHSGINGVLVTAAAQERPFDYHYRYFWPWAGTNEDPVTGGVQTFLAKYWSDKLGKKEMRAFQSSQRTGVMRVALAGDKVMIFGKAVVVLEGKLLV